MDEIYRLPTDHEWSCAVDIGDKEDITSSPAVKDKGIDGVFPWGRSWPPPSDAGNYWSEELRPLLNGGRFAFGTGELAGRRDGHATTSPVGSYAPGPHGLFDLGGNAWEWCQDRYVPNQTPRVLRGASWNTDERSNLLSSVRNRRPPNYVSPGCGFRCVLGPPVPVAGAPTPGGS
jgi:formylglycine-generating enzyme required for sulfatase activity